MALQHASSSSPPYVLLVAPTTILAAPTTILAAPSAISAVTWGQVAGYLTPCINYAMGHGSAPPEVCCSGVRNLNAAARNTAGRQAACKCLKQITGSAFV